MKQFAFFIAFLFISSTVSADERVRTLEKFSELRVSDGINVQIFRGEMNSATVNVNSGEETDVLTKIENGVLRINWKKGVNTNRVANVQVYYTKLHTIKAGAGSSINSKQTLKSKDLSITSASGSKIKLEIACDLLVAKVNSGASMSLSGESTLQKVEVSSGASYKSEELITATTEVKASTGASAKVHSTNTIKAKSSTGASIRYAGNPSVKDIEQSKITGSSVQAF